MALAASASLSLVNANSKKSALVVSNSLGVTPYLLFLFLGNLIATHSIQSKARQHQNQ